MTYKILGGSLFWSLFEAESGVPLSRDILRGGITGTHSPGPPASLVSGFTTDATVRDEKLSASLKFWRSFCNSFWSSMEETSLPLLLAPSLQSLPPQLLL